MPSHRQLREHHSLALRIRQAAAEDDTEACSEEHRQLRKFTAVVKRFTFTERMHAWWYCQMVANPEHHAMLLVGEWKAIESIARRQGELQEADYQAQKRCNEAQRRRSASA